MECAGLAYERACPTRVGTTGWSVLAWLMREPARHGRVLLGGVLAFLMREPARHGWVLLSGVLAWLMREPARHGWVLLGGVCWPGW